MSRPPSPAHESWDDGQEDDDEHVCTASQAGDDGDEVERGRNKVPEWANRPEAVPPQDYSHVSRAAFELRSVPTIIPLPPGFGNGKRRREDNGGLALDMTMKRPLSGQTALVRDAWMALAAVVALHRESDLKRLIEGEQAELLAASGRVMTDASAAAPRRFALTLLIRDSSTCVQRVALLDAIGFMARFGGEDRVASHVRMSILTDRPAQQYASTHAHTLKHGVELALVLVGDGTDGLQAHFGEMPYEKSTLENYRNLTRVAAALFLRADAMSLAPSSVFRIGSVTEKGLVDAYVASIKEVDDEFWGQLMICHPFALLDTKLDFEHHRTFVKLVPEAVPVTHPTVSWGMLMYADGKHDAVHEYCLAAKREDQRMHPNRPPESPFGIPAPQTTRDNTLELHIFSVSADLVSLRGKISCFGLEAAPGSVVCKYPHAGIHRMVYRLARFDDAFKTKQFVLPVAKWQIDSAHRCEHMPQWEVVSEGVRKYMDAFARPPTRSEPSCFGHRFNLARGYAPPSKEDSLLANMFGVFNSGAARLGDVFEKFQKLEEAPSHIPEFLGDAMARYGSDQSVADTFSRIVHAMQNHDDEVERLNTKVQRLEQQLDTKPVTTPTAIPATSRETATDLLRAMGRKPKKGRVIPEPVAGPAVTAVVYAYAFARGAAENSKESKWGKKNVSTLPTFEAISKVIGQLDACPTVLLRQAVDGEVDFFKIRNEGRSPQRITALEALELSRDTAAAFLLFDVDRVKLIPLVRA